MGIMTLKVIAYARNGHTDKFGIPRQSREESPILTRIVFEPEYRVKEALRGIEGYSHLWLVWGFSELCSLTADAVGPSDDCKTADAVGPSDDCKTQAGPAVGLSWSPTVRPPRLGGNKRMGVFATRSPYRPNPIGLSSVRLVEVTPEGDLIVSGADVLDGTPIYDIKPYLSFSDCHEDASNGFAEGTKGYSLKVDWGAFGSKKEAQKSEEECIKEDLEYILSQDPRPGYQDDPEREYKLDYKGWTVTFKVRGDTVLVLKIAKLNKISESTNL